MTKRRRTTPVAATTSLRPRVELQIPPPVAGAPVLTGGRGDMVVEAVTIKEFRNMRENEDIDPDQS
jgi:hypothetical protein